MTNEEIDQYKKILADQRVQNERARLLMEEQARHYERDMRDRLAETFFNSMRVVQGEATTHDDVARVAFERADAFMRARRK